MRRLERQRGRGRDDYPIRLVWNSLLASVVFQHAKDDAGKAASLCAANLLRVFIRDVGPLSRIERLVKVRGFVNSDAAFTEQHVVMNGASQLFLEVLGDAGHHARSTVGMANLPLGATVEVEIIGRLSS